MGRPDHARCAKRWHSVQRGGHSGGNAGSGSCGCGVPIRGLGNLGSGLMPSVTVGDVLAWSKHGSTLRHASRPPYSYYACQTRLVPPVMLKSRKASHFWQHASFQQLEAITNPPRRATLADVFRAVPLPVCSTTRRKPGRPAPCPSLYPVPRPRAGRPAWFCLVPRQGQRQSKLEAGRLGRPAGGRSSGTAFSGAPTAPTPYPWRSGRPILVFPALVLLLGVCNPLPWQKDWRAPRTTSPGCPEP